MNGPTDNVVTVAAVDLGASSGRVMLGVVDPVAAHPVGLREVHRFGNEPVELATRAASGGVGPGPHLPHGLHWDVVGLYREVLTGLRLAGLEAARLGLPAPASIGIDSWAVDYGLLDAQGALIGTPFCYRDERTAAGVDRVHAVCSHEQLYAVNGLQFLPFNTVYQLAAEQGTPRWESARTMLLLPDLLATGSRAPSERRSPTPRRRACSTWRPGSGRRRWRRRSASRRRCCPRCGSPATRWAHCCRTWRRRRVCRSGPS